MISLTEGDSLLASFSRLLTKLISFGVYAGIVYAMIKMFTLRIDFEKHSIESKVAFSQNDFFKALEDIMPYTIWIGKISLGSEIVLALWRCVSEEQGVLSKLWSCCKCLVFTGLAVYMFTISLVPHCLVDQTATASITPQVRQLHDNVRNLNLVHSYGLFRRMTGVGGRPEVIMEGSHSLNSGWKAYDFLYKPGNVSNTPPFVAPHQPRLDWQMWFAALGSYEHAPWFINFAYRLLEGKQEVLDLMGSNPFPEKPPKYIRAKLYTYRYTTLKSNSSNWWRRKFERDYMPAISKETKGLKDHLQHHGIIQGSTKGNNKSQKNATEENFIQSLLSAIRSYIGTLSGPILIFSLFVPAVVLSRVS